MNDFERQCGVKRGGPLMPQADDSQRVMSCYDFKDSDGETLERDCWYWITSPAEGDEWYPISVQDTYYIMDGDLRHDFGELRDLTVRKAVLPGLS